MNFGLVTVTQNLDSIPGALDDQGYTAQWTAPEILNEQGTYSKKADVFSFAMVMIEVRHGQLTVDAWLIHVLYQHRCSLARFHSIIAYLPRLCWP